PQPTHSRVGDRERFRDVNAAPSHALVTPVRRSMIFVPALGRYLLAKHREARHTTGAVDQSMDDHRRDQPAAEEDDACQHETDQPGLHNPSWSLVACPKPNAIETITTAGAIPT